MIELQNYADGIVLLVRAQPGAGSNGIRGMHGGALKVAVTQVAEKGKANAAILEALAEGLGLKPSQLELIRGDTQRQKKFLVRGIDRDELAKRIEAAIQ
jgi:uncharacterized protein (TIGR00251 family)